MSPLVESLASTSSTVAAAVLGHREGVVHRVAAASFTGVTVTVTVAVAVPPLPSAIVYVNVVVPLKLGAGVKRTTPPVSVTVPLAGCVTAVTVSVSPVSGARRVVGQHVHRRGAAVLGHRERVVVGRRRIVHRVDRDGDGRRVRLPPLPSDTVYVNVVVPKKLAAGVKLTLEAVKVTVPLAGWVTAVMVSVSPVSGAVRVVGQHVELRGAAVLDHR